jgi:hypothetical protein
VVGGRGSKGTEGQLFCVVLHPEPINCFKEFSKMPPDHPISIAQESKKYPIAPVKFVLKQL